MLNDLRHTSLPHFTREGRPMVRSVFAGRLRLTLAVPVLPHCGLSASAASDSGAASLGPMGTAFCGMSARCATDVGGLQPPHKAGYEPKRICAVKPVQLLTGGGGQSPNWVTSRRRTPRRHFVVVLPAGDAGGGAARRTKSHHCLPAAKERGCGVIPLGSASRCTTSLRNRPFTRPSGLPFAELQNRRPAH